MKNAKFDEYIKKLRSGGSIELEPHDCAYFISLFARYDENISFYVEINDGMVTLTSGTPSQAERDKYRDMSIDELIEKGKEKG